VPIVSRQTACSDATATQSHRRGQLSGSRPAARPPPTPCRAFAVRRSRFSHAAAAARSGCSTRPSVWVSVPGAITARAVRRLRSEHFEELAPSGS
jgi:hypothetical protein